MMLGSILLVIVQNQFWWQRLMLTSRNIFKILRLLDIDCRFWYNEMKHKWKLKWILYFAEDKKNTWFILNWILSTTYTFASFIRLRFLKFCYYSRISTMKVDCRRCLLLRHEWSCWSIYFPNILDLFSYHFYFLL